MLWLVHVQYIKIWRVKCPSLAGRWVLLWVFPFGAAHSRWPSGTLRSDAGDELGVFRVLDVVFRVKSHELSQSINQSNPCQDPISAPGQELVAGFLMMRNEVNTLPVYVWNGGTSTSTLSPLIHSIVFASKLTCMPIVLKRSSLSFSFMLGKWCFPLISPEMKRRKMSRCWCEQRCLWNPQLSIFRRSHRKALQTVVWQSSLHWQPWSCWDDHNGFGFLWDWVQVIGGSFCSTMGTVCYSGYSASSST